MSECPELHEWEQLLAGPLDDAAVERLQRHLDVCSSCRERLATFTYTDKLVPDQPSHWHNRSSSSAALKEAIRRLQTAPGDRSPAAASATPAVALPFLRPTDQAGFLGRLGNYEVRRVIGHGGAGIVLEGRDPLLKRIVAIKMLLPWTVLDEETKGRFLREAQSAAALMHENVVAIHAVDQVEGRPFLVLEYVDGESLQDRLKREGKLPLDDVVRIGAQVARGLAAAHGRGLIHRDIKPANILLMQDTGQAKIADFGLAKPTGDDGLTIAGTMLGTPEFMSPEQATRKKPDERSDIFGLGAVLYYAATGVSPFRGEALLDTLDNVRRCQPQPLHQLDSTLPNWFCDLVHRLLDKEPQSRLGWAAAVAEVLERSGSPATIVEHSASAATTKTVLPVDSIRTATRLWWPVAVIAVVALSTVAIVVMRGTPSGEARAPEKPQQLPPSEANSLPSSQRPPQAGFTVSGRDNLFADLAAAVAAANDSEVIEVHGNGPYLTPPVTITGKRLTIRAAIGSHPVFLSETPSSAGTKPLLSSDTDLRLEGLEIHWAMEPRQGLSEVDMLARSIVATTHGRLLVAHCRIVSERLNGCVGGTCRTMIVHHCHLVTKNGMGVFWRVEPGGRLDISGSLLENYLALTLLSGVGAPSAASAQIRMSRSTVAAVDGIQLIVETPPRQPIPYALDHSLIDAENLFSLMTRPTPRAKAATKVNEPLSQLQSYVTWSDESNVYRRGMQYVVWPVAGQRGARQAADVTGVERWLELWQLPTDKSIEGQMRYQPRAEGSKMAPLVLDEVVDASGEPPVEIGAPAEQVGPGAAYDAWRKSREYANWPSF